ncbi:MAG: mandelate racemase/muconate lactonizing enzyme family protein, partial [Candidatus Brocadiia bacterium]|nr:mandelate racemase/muconate lactonizing enzyme family protein [Candidatus Brocadiia bacterium]
MKITGMELVGVRVNQWLDWVFVLVDTDAGIRGLGELAPGGKTPDCLAALRDLGASLVGRDPRQIEPFVHERTRDQPERAHRLALSAVEQALWDILGKSLGVPVYRLLGGACREEIRLYANINRVSRRPEERTPEFFARNAVAAVAEGFDAVKLAPFDGMPGEIDRARDVAPGIAATEAVRKAVGPGVDLLIDCHSHFTVAGALDVADALRDLDLFWFEQPTPESDLAGLRRIKEQSG